jgi:hypothetical protein
VVVLGEVAPDVTLRSGVAVLVGSLLVARGLSISASILASVWGLIL